MRVLRTRKGFLVSGSCELIFNGCDSVRRLDAWMFALHCGYVPV